MADLLRRQMSKALGGREMSGKKVS